MLFAEKLVTEVLAPVPHRHWTFSIARVLRGLIERDRKLLGLLSQTAYAAILKTFQALFDRTDVRPGCVVSLQTAHIPDSGRHNQRFYGAYSNRARVIPSSAGVDSADGAADAQPEKDNFDFTREARSTWARLLRKIFEVDPLVCKCGARMQIISIITEPRVVDRILRHRESEHCKTKDPFEPRAPPRARTRIRSRQ